MHCPILPIIYLRQYNHLLIYDFLSYIVILFMVIIAKLLTTNKFFDLQSKKSYEQTRKKAIS